MKPRAVASVIVGWIAVITTASSAQPGGVARGTGAAVVAPSSDRERGGSLRAAGVAVAGA
jgi:hypothetical protein